MFPVLWLCGPPGVGKSTVAWKIFTDLLCSGINSGFVDVDQLGICYPEPPADPGRHRMQLENLAAVVDTYRSAGARCAIVSGVVDAEHGVDHDQLRDITLTLCRVNRSFDVQAGHGEDGYRAVRVGDQQFHLGAARAPYPRRRPEPGALWRRGGSAHLPRSEVAVADVPKPLMHSATSMYRLTRAVISIPM